MRTRQSAARRQRPTTHARGSSLHRARRDARDHTNALRSARLVSWSLVNLCRPCAHGVETRFAKSRYLATLEICETKFLQRATRNTTHRASGHIANETYREPRAGLQRPNAGCSTEEERLVAGGPCGLSTGVDKAVGNSRGRSWSLLLEPSLKIFGIKRLARFARASTARNSRAGFAPWFRCL